jgi:DUF1680 family protein
MYAVKDDAVYINLFANSTASVVVNKKEVQIVQENNYPWEGALAFKIDPKSSGAFKLLIRIPGWAQNKAMPSDLYAFTDQQTVKIPITINGKPVEYVIDHGYAVLSKTWKKGDVVSVLLPMDVKKIVSHTKIENNNGKIALQRGPLVYCAEWPDNSGIASNLILPENASFTTEKKTDLLNGITVVKSEALAIQIDADKNWVSTKVQPFIAIPYYAWAHRGKGEMMIWLPQRVTGIEILSNK